MVLLSQATLETGFDMLWSPFRSSAGPAAAAVQASDPRRPCFQSSNVRRLAALPPGLVAADIDLGPYIVALSPHRVVAAPYHRLEKGILANHAIFTGAPGEALAAAARARRRLCGAVRRPCGHRPAPVPQAAMPPCRPDCSQASGSTRCRNFPRLPARPIRVWRVMPAS